MDSFNTKTFWNDRLKDGWDLQGVGYAVLGLPFNQWMYRLRARIVSRSIARLPVGNRILDIGSGTGFYIDLWQKPGRAVDGMDIAPAVVEYLQKRYPNSRITQGSIGSPLIIAEQYDAVSAFDVLFHIVDDAEYEQALKNISASLRSGGYFLYTDNLPVSRVSFTHQISRSREEVLKALAQNGLMVLDIRPMFFFMNAPLASKSNILHTYWKGLVAILYRYPLIGNILGSFLYVLEICILPFIQDGPSTKLIIAQKMEIK